MGASIVEGRCEELRDPNVVNIIISMCDGPDQNSPSMYFAC